MSDLNVASWSAKALNLVQNKLNNFFLKDSQKNKCIPLIVRKQKVGILLPEVVEALHQYSDVFHIERFFVTLTEKHCDETCEQLSKTIHNVIVDLTKRDMFEALKGWRNENYAVTHSFTIPPVFTLERAATSLFGVKTYGSHMNGYIKHPTKGVCMWIAKRSSTKQTFPGMLDNMVAGGMSVGFDAKETMIKECEEEAGIPREIAANVVPTGCISYIYEDKRGIFPETQYCFDLELPVTFEPRPVDGEVEEFKLYTIDEVKQLIVQLNFKPNCAGVILDFLIRKGYISPETEPYYLQLVQYIHILI